MSCVHACESPARICWIKSRSLSDAMRAAYLTGDRAASGLDARDRKRGGGYEYDRQRPQSAGVVPLGELIEPDVAGQGAEGDHGNAESVGHPVDPLPDAERAVSLGQFQ